jgi:type IV secretory pathway protease TraF
MKPGSRRSSVETNAGMLACRRVVIAGISAAAVAMLAVPTNVSSAQLVWNLTPSAPAGLYRIERGAWNVGDRVAVLPSQDLAADLDERGVLRNGKLLIKRVVASALDMVCRKDDEISVNGKAVVRARSVDSKGIRLPFWQGCVTLNDTEVFLLGDTAGSYDGRYFGVTNASEIVGKAIVLVFFEQRAYVSMPMAPR